MTNDEKPTDFEARMAALAAGFQKENESTDRAKREMEDREAARKATKDQLRDRANEFLNRLPRRVDAINAELRPHRRSIIHQTPANNMGQNLVFAELLFRGAPTYRTPVLHMLLIEGPEPRVEAMISEQNDFELPDDWDTDRGIIEILVTFAERALSSIS